MREPIQILQKYWGYTNFRPLQQEIIENVLRGRDTVALLPTGGGKSLCFQVPALAMEGICIVVSPLIALMNDQVNRLQQMGIKSIALTGRIHYSDLDRLLENAIFGNYKFLYLSPERIQQDLVQARIAQMPVNLWAIDEAHCISQWGNDFRPAYRNINILREIHPEVPTIALTATATPEVLTDTILELHLRNPEIFKKSFFRENLAYVTRYEEDKLYAIEQLLKKNEPAIIYTRNRKRTETLSHELNLRHFQSDYFHGGISDQEKQQKLHNWLTEKKPIMVATNAFGMGIDKPNVRHVIHYEMPDSMESYFQEAGRAGRDGLPAQAVLLYNPSDFKTLQEQYINNLPTTDFVKEVYRKLCNFFYIAYGEGAYTTHAFNFEKFCVQYQLPTTKTFNAITALDRLGIVSLSLDYGQKSQVQFLIPSEELLRYFENNRTHSLIGKTLLRIYTGIYENPTPIDLELIAAKSNQPIPTIIQVLEKFSKDEIARVQIVTTDAWITFNERREDNRTINRVARLLQKYNENKIQLVRSMMQYVQDDTTCNSVKLLQYFGETTYSPCGICNQCNQENTLPSRKEMHFMAQTIMLCIEENEAVSSREICEKTNFAADKVVYVLQQLLDARKIILNSKNQYMLA